MRVGNRWPDQGSARVRPRFCTAQFEFQKTKPEHSVRQVEIGSRIQLAQLPHNGNTRPVAAVNSFGFGGTNAHVVLQAAPLKEFGKISNPSADRPFVLPISARDDVALREYAKAFRKVARGRLNRVIRFLLFGWCP